ncbi:MAG: family 1 glycosylhydrolase [Armatimonadetes bacterium]|nr:family 1 glycosylhydrolase [Armatimonadota bacterium]
MNTILFATGIENSYPTVQGGKRRDLAAETGHYKRWREDLQLCKEIGAHVVRYGPPYYIVHGGPHSYDWSYVDDELAYIRELGLIPIVDLCHFGVPDWVGSFQNGDWPQLFADFADAFAARYPWVVYYTPVNEILVCARFSGKEGIWNEQLKSDKAMIAAHKHMCKATLLSIERILRHRSDAVFFQSETTEAFFAHSPEMQAEADFHNELRFLTFDFLYGHPPNGDALMFLMKNGATPQDYQWFMEHGRKAAPHCVMGMDYYAMNERALHPDGSQEAIGPVLGWNNIARGYYERYRRPMMLTETNALDPQEAPGWLWKTWHNVLALRKEGVPVVGFTWYSLIDQVDWDIQLREIRGKVNGNGLFTLERQPQPVATAFRDLVRHYGDLPVLEDFPIGNMRGPLSERWLADAVETKRAP